MPGVEPFLRRGVVLAAFIVASLLVTAFDSRAGLTLLGAGVAGWLIWGGVRRVMDLYSDSTR
jgi:hypothetical protein